MFTTSFKSQRWFAAGVLTAAASLGSLGLTGCERKEKVVDIKVPGVEVEVERNVDTGQVEVETNKN